MKVAKNPIQAKLEQAIALQNAGNAKKASALFLQVLKAHPDNIFALYSLAAIESNLGNDAIAINYAKRAVAVNPAFAQARMAHSVILYKLGKFEESLAEIAQALTLQPDLPGAQQHKESVLIASKAGMTPTPVGTGPSAQANLKAIQLQDQGKLEEAEQAFHQVLAYYPEDFVALDRMPLMLAHKEPCLVTRLPLQSAPSRSSG